MIIESGLGNGKLAAVDGDNRLVTSAFNIPFVHLIAKDYQRVFAANAITTIGGAGETVAMHLTNTSADQTMVITRIGVQAVTLTGGTAIPNGNDYFTVEFGYDYASGGAPRPLVNTSAGSAVQAEATCYQDNPVVSGSGDEWGRYYPVNAAPAEFKTEGGVIILPKQSLTIKWNGTATSGLLYCSAGFAMTDVGEYSG